MVRRLESAEQAVHDCLELDATPAEGASSRKGPATLELSVVMPCLNEADTLATCIRKAQRAMAEHGIAGEIVVADNGSTDGSIDIAMRLGARVVHVAEKGYGNALRGGIAASRGKYVIMGDADDSYDFLEIPKFVDKLREGYDLAQGCRLPSGGGKVLPGAMPVTHRWIGNPTFSSMVRRMFRAPIHDVYCGLRGFTREYYDRLELQTTGMEFATEMIIKASLFRAKVGEVPTTLHPDGRTSHPPHLRTIRDGWRTLRFFLMYSPRWLFLIPGVAALTTGAAIYAASTFRPDMLGNGWSGALMCAASLIILIGFQLVQLAVFAKTFAISQRMIPRDSRLEKFAQAVTLERGLALGSVALVGGAGLTIYAAWSSQAVGGWAVGDVFTQFLPGAMLAALGLQAIFASFFVNILQMARRN